MIRFQSIVILILGISLFYILNYKNEYEIKINDKLIVCESKVTYDDRILLKKCTSKHTPNYEFELKLEIVNAKEL